MCFIRSCHLHNKQRQNSSFIKNVGRHKNRFSCCLSSWRQQETFRVAIFWWRLERFFAVSSSSSFWLLMFSLFGVLRFGERRVTCWEYFSGGELYRDYFLSAASKYIYPRNLICLELNSVHLLYSFLIFSHAVLGTRSPTSGWSTISLNLFLAGRRTRDLYSTSFMLMKYVSLNFIPILNSFDYAKLGFPSSCLRAISV